MSNTTRGCRAAARKAIVNIKRDMEILEQGSGYGTEKMDTLAYAAAFAASKEGADGYNDEKSILAKNNKTKKTHVKTKKRKTNDAPAVPKNQKKVAFADDTKNEAKNIKHHNSSSEDDSLPTSTSHSTGLTSSDKKSEALETDDDDDCYCFYFNYGGEDGDEEEEEQVTMYKYGNQYITASDLVQRFDHQKRCVERHLHSNGPMKLSRRLEHRIRMDNQHTGPLSPLLLQKLDFTNPKFCTIITKK